MTKKQAANLKGTVKIAPTFQIASRIVPSGSDPLVEITVDKGVHAAYVTEEDNSAGGNLEEVKCC